MGALAAVVKINMLSKLRSQTISVVNLAAVTTSPRMPRSIVDVTDMPPVSVKCLERARLEAERRYCGNNGTALS